MIWIIALALLLLGALPVRFRGAFALLALIGGLFLPGLTVPKLVAPVLAFFLFLDAARMHLPKIYHFHKEAVRLVLIGGALTAFGGAFLAHYLFIVAWPGAWVIGIALAATDLKVGWCRSETLNVEGGVTSVLAGLGILFFFYAWWGVLIGLGVGLAVGLVGRIESKWSPYVLPLGLYYFGEYIGISGLACAIGGGIAFGHFARLRAGRLFDVGRREGMLFFLVVLALFGARASGLRWEYFAYALLMLIPVRLLSVWVSLARLKLSYFGAKGLIPIATFLLFYPSPLLCAVILTSILLHTAVTAWASSKWGERPTLRLPKMGCR